MILYHGSNIKVNHPRIIASKRLLDFGTGFYLTSDKEQAERWAARTTDRRKEGAPLISVFSVNVDMFNNLNVLKFDAADMEWLKYVTSNRSGVMEKDLFDVVQGPVANDQAIRTVNNYLHGYLTAEMAIQLLLPQKLKDQFAFKTEKGLSILEFEEVIKI